MEYARVTRDMAHPADRIWRAARSFGGIAAWIVGVTDCTLEGPEAVGVVRRVGLGGHAVRERLAEFDDAARRTRYEILPPHGLPAENVRSTIVVEPLGAAASRVIWFSEADMDAADPALTRRIEGFFAASLARLEGLCDAPAP